MKIETSQLIHRFIPAKEGGAKNILILVHGRGGNLKLLEFYSKRFNLPNLHYLAIQAPFVEQREDQVAKNESGWSWYINPGRKGLEESRSKLSAMIEEIHQQGIPYNKIFWLGFSQGAAMGLDTFLRSPHILGGALCISGLIVKATDYPQAFSPMAARQRLLITHGARDEIISLEEAEKTYQVLRESNIPFEFKIYDKPHSFHLQEEVPYLEAKLQDWIKN